MNSTIREMKVVFSAHERLSLWQLLTCCPLPGLSTISPKSTVRRRFSARNPNASVDHHGRKRRRVGATGYFAR
jgi:hypothetical protein